MGLGAGREWRFLGEWGAGLAGSAPSPSAFSGRGQRYGPIRVAPLTGRRRGWGAVQGLCLGDSGRRQHPRCSVLLQMPGEGRGSGMLRDVPGDLHVTGFLGSFSITSPVFWFLFCSFAADFRAVWSGGCGFHGWRRALHSVIGRHVRLCERIILRIDERNIRIGWSILNQICCLSPAHRCPSISSHASAAPLTGAPAESAKNPASAANEATKRNPDTSTDH